MSIINQASGGSCSTSPQEAFRIADLPSKYAAIEWAMRFGDVVKVSEVEAGTFRSGEILLGTARLSICEPERSRRDRLLPYVHRRQEGPEGLRRRGEGPGHFLALTRDKLVGDSFVPNLDDGYLGGPLGAKDYRRFPDAFAEQRLCDRGGHADLAGVQVDLVGAYDAVRHFGAVFVFDGEPGAEEDLFKVLLGGATTFTASSLLRKKRMRRSISRSFFLP